MQSGESKFIFNYHYQLQNYCILHYNRGVAIRECINSFNTTAIKVLVVVMLCSLSKVFRRKCMFSISLVFEHYRQKD